MAQLKASVLAKIRRKSLLVPSGCMEWTGSRNDSGYGRLIVNGKLWLAHRLVWSSQRGDIANGLQVLHRCDNPACVNIEHLFLGTPSDNMADMYAKGRHPVPAAFVESARRDKSGASNPNARLTVDAVRAIRSSGESCTALARQFGVTRNAVVLARTGATWRNV